MFSRSVFTVFTAGLAALASAYTTPVGDPSGNPTSEPALNEIVPAGKPFAITWTPTTEGTITLVLLRGPSANVVPIATIVEGIANTGTYEWTPSTSLEADTTHYGIQLIVDATGQYQYTPQFGISNSKPSSVSSSVASTSSSAVASSSSAVASSSSAVVSSSSSKTVLVSAASTPCSTTTSAKAPVWTANSTSYFVGTGTAYSSHVASTGYAISNSSIVYPTKSMTVPSSLLTTVTAAGSSAAAASSAVATGAAGHVKAGLGLVGAIAGLVMAL